jgi:SnoaL-like protein
MTAGRAGSLTAPAGPTLEQRIKRLEDLEAVRDVTARYAAAVSKGWNGKTVDLAAIGSVFACDARWESRDMGLAADGVDAIIASLPRSTSMVEFSMHAFLNPVLTLDGDTASGSWLLWIASVIGQDPRAVYLSADMTYTRTDQGWRIQAVDVHHGLRLPPG